MVGSDNLSEVVLTDNVRHQSSDWSREVIGELLVDSLHSTHMWESLKSIWNQWSPGTGPQGLRQSQQRQFEWVSPRTHTGCRHGLRLTLLTLLNNQSKHGQECQFLSFCHLFLPKLVVGEKARLEKVQRQLAIHARPTQFPQNWQAPAFMLIFRIMGAGFTFKFLLIRQRINMDAGHNADDTIITKILVAQARFFRVSHC